MARHFHTHITVDAGAFEESKHPRAANGQFGHLGGGKYNHAQAASEHKKAAEKEADRY